MIERRNFKFWMRVAAVSCQLMICAWQTKAQEQWEKEGEIKDVEFEIVKSREILLPRANRNFNKVPPRPFEPIKPAMSYEIKNFKFATPEYNAVIRPLKLQQETLSRIYGNYLSAGFGNYASFFGEGAVTTKRDKDKFLGAHFYTRSFGNGPVAGQASGASATDIDLFGKLIGRDITFSGNAAYNNRGTYFYGYSPIPVLEDNRDKLRQRYSIYSVNAGIENTRAGDFNYSLKMGYSHLEDHYRATENEFSTLFNSAYKIDDKSKFILNADYFLINRTDSLINTRRHLFRIKPAYQFSPVDNLLLTAGLNIALQSEGSTEFHVYPNVKAQYALGKNAEAYGIITGDLDKVNLHTLSAENLWLNSNQPIQNTNRTAEFIAGLKGKAGRKVSYDVGISAATLKNYYYYLNLDVAASTLFNKFNLVYDGQTQRVNPYAEIGYSQSEAFRFVLRGDYYSYNTENISQAFHRPTYKVNFNARYNIYDKILFEAGVMAMGGMKAIDPSLAVITLAPGIDLNMKARYFFSREFSAFIQFNNMLSNNYPIYQSYPARGFQVLAGVSWSF